MKWNPPPGRMFVFAVVLPFVSIASILSSVTSIVGASEEPGEPFRHGPEYFPADDPDAEAVRELALRGELPLGFATVRPFTRSVLARSLRSGNSAGSATRDLLVEEVEDELGTLSGSPRPRRGVAAFERIIPGGSFRLRPYVWFDAKWKDARGISWGDQPRVGARGTAHYGPRFAVHQDVFLGRVRDGRRFADALVNHTDLLVFVESAYASFQSDHWEARIGRLRQSVGPGGESSLLLSPRAGAFDHLGYSVRLGSLRFRSMTGVLRTATEKNIALHRLEWSAHPRFILAVTEGAVFQGSPVQPLYLMGFVPYTIVERLQGQDALSANGVPLVRNNLVWQFDATWRAFRSGAVWSEILVDDVGTETSDLPTRLGFQVGVDVVPRTRWGDAKLGLRAAKVYDFTYSVSYENSDWAHQGRPLGYPEGPDVEQASVELGIRPTKEWSTSVRLQVIRKGEGRIGSPWYGEGDPRSEQNPPGPEYDLRGVVERRLGIDWTLAWTPSGTVRIESRVHIEAVENLDHEAGNDEPEARFDLLARWHR